MSDPLDLTLGDVSLLLARCYDAPEKSRIVGRLDFTNGEIPVSVEVGREFHGYLVVRIIESDFRLRHLRSGQSASRNHALLKPNHEALGRPRGLSVTRLDGPTRR